MRLYIGNLVASVTEDDIRELFQDYGFVEDVHLIIDRETGKSQGFAIVEMMHDNEGDEALEYLEYRELKGRHLHVTLARSRGGRGGHGGYRGH